MPAFSRSDQHRHDVTSYHLPIHVHYAVVEDAVIFMDLRSDQYSLLTGEKAQLFATSFGPASQARERVLLIDPSASDESARARYALVTELLNCNLLIRGSEPTPTNRAKLPPPRGDFLAVGDARPARMRLRDVRRFFTACLASAWRLRYTTVEDTVGAVERRRRTGRPDHPRDLSELHRLVAVFRRLRPLFPKDALCLFDSLALLEFLAPYGYCPHWVFAVKLNPWSAHCWAQYADICLNEDAERARQYTVILVA